MRSVFRVLFTSLVLGSFAVSASDKPSIYHQAFEELYQQGQFNGAVLIAKDGNVLINAYFGAADKLENKALSADTLYRLASVSKTITSTALLSLVDAGQLALDDRVQKFLPAFPYPDITLRHILQHNSGLPDYIFGLGDYWNDSKGLMTNQDVLNWLIESKPEVAFKQGDGWEYSNTGYALMPLIIESVTQESYSDYVRRGVFSKAGMQNSYHISELGPNEIERAAKGHGFDYSSGDDLRVDKHPMLANEFKTDKVYGAGDVFSTALDLLAFDQALNAGKIISSDLQKSAYTSPILPEGFPAGYGLGWQVAESQFTGRIIHHHGQGDGYRTRFYRFIDKGITIITLQNAREKYADDVVRVAQEIVFKDRYTLPKLSLAESLSRSMSKEGPDATLQLVAAAAEHPGKWSLDERDLNNFALTYWFQGNRELALKLFTSYLTLMPNNPNAYSTLAEALEESGEHQQSQINYRRALEVAEKTPEKYATEIKALRKQVSE